MICAICPNLSKPAALATALQAAQKLREHDPQTVIRMEETLHDAVPDGSGIDFLPADTLFSGADFAAAIGGDGTILRCANRILAHAAKTAAPPVPLIGINTGTLGFLAAFETDELDMLRCLTTGEYEITDRMMLYTEITAGGQILPFHALNDIYTSCPDGRICNFDVAVDGRLVSRYRADGIIFSTPTGSTAYALSAGGPVMEPDLLLIEMVLICPHSLFARPMFFSPQRSICVTYRGAGGLLVHVDGAEAALLQDGESFRVTRSPRSMPFVNCKGHAFYDALNGKLMRPLKAPDAQ